MLLTIHNLPSHARYSDVKKLIQSKCGPLEVILDNLVSKNKGKSVTVGLADEEDAAILVRKINGVYMDGVELYIEDTRQKKRLEQQTYHSSDILSKHSDDLSGKLVQYPHLQPQAVMPVMPNNQNLMNYGMSPFGMYVPQAVQNAGFVGYGQQMVQNISEVSMQNVNATENPGISQTLQGGTWEQHNNAMEANIYEPETKKSRWNPHSRDYSQNNTSDDLRIENYDTRTTFDEKGRRITHPTKPFNKPSIESTNRNNGDDRKDSYRNRTDSRGRQTKLQQDSQVRAGFASTSGTKMNLNAFDIPPLMPEFRENMSSNYVPEYNDTPSSLRNYKNPPVLAQETREQRPIHPGAYRSDNSEVFKNYRERQHEQPVWTNESDRRNECDNYDLDRQMQSNAWPLDRNNFDRDVPQSGNYNNRKRHFDDGSYDISGSANRTWSNNRPEDFDNSGRSGRFHDSQEVRNDWRNKISPQGYPKPTFTNRQESGPPDSFKFQDRQDFKAHNESRGPKNDNRGPRNDNRGPHNDNRGPRNESRGPRNDSRGLRNDSRGPRNDSRGPRNDSRGPRNDSRGPPNDNRGPRNDFDKKRSWETRDNTTHTGPRRPRLPTKRADDPIKVPQNPSGFQSKLPAPSKFVQGAPKPHVKVSLTTLMHKDVTLRGQTTSHIAKNMIRDFQLDRTEAPLVLKPLKVSIRSRIDLILGEEIATSMEEILQKYRKKFDEKDDAAFLDAVLAKLENPPKIVKTILKGDLSAKPLAKNKAQGKPVTNPGDKIPKFPNADKSEMKRQKQQGKLEFKDENLYELPEPLKTALKEEIEGMGCLFDAYECATDEEKKIVNRIKKQAVPDLKKAMKLNTTKRLLNINSNLLVRIFIHGKPPAGNEMNTFLKNYGVESCRKSKAGTFLVASCKGFDSYDKLLTMGSTDVGGCNVSIKPLHIAGFKTRPSRDAVIKQRKNFVKRQIEANQSAKIEDDQSVKIEDDQSAKIEDDQSAKIEDDQSVKIEDDQSAEIEEDLDNEGNENPDDLEDY